MTFAPHFRAEFMEPVFEELGSLFTHDETMARSPLWLRNTREASEASRSLGACGAHTIADMVRQNGDILGLCSNNMLLHVLREIGGNPIDNIGAGNGSIVFPNSAEPSSTKATEDALAKAYHHRLSHSQGPHDGVRGYIASSSLVALINAMAEMKRAAELGLAGFSGGATGGVAFLYSGSAIAAEVRKAAWHMNLTEDRVIPWEDPGADASMPKMLSALGPTTAIVDIASDGDALVDRDATLSAWGFGTRARILLSERDISGLFVAAHRRHDLFFSPSAGQLSPALHQGRFHSLCMSTHRAVGGPPAVLCLTLDPLTILDATIYGSVSMPTIEGSRNGGLALFLSSCLAEAPT